MNENMNLIYWVIGALIVLVLVLATGLLILSDRSAKTSAKQHPENTLDKLEIIIRLLMGGARLTPQKWDDDAVKMWATSIGLTVEELPNGDVIFKRPPPVPTVTPTASG